MGILGKFFKGSSNSTNNLSAMNYYNQGVEEGFRGNESKALKAYSRAIQLNSSFKEAYFNRGNTHFRLKEYFEAIKDFDKAIEIDSRFASAINNRGATKLQLGDNDGAKNDFLLSSKLGDVNAKNALKEYELRYDRVDSYNDEINFKPDYRDTILYNGYIPYRANGNVLGDLIEFEQYNNPEKKIPFNTNLTIQAYINDHEKFDLVRNRDGKSFATFQITTAQGTFASTGRIFNNETHGIMWEYMKLDDPSKVMYIKLPLNENFITGRKCLEITLK